MPVDKHVLDLIPLYILDSLDEAETVVVVEHLSLCESCRAEWQAYQAVVDDLAWAAPDAAPGPHLHQQLLDRISPRPAEAASPDWRQIFTGFSIIAIIIACLGLFGLVLNSTQQRSKEIGIRKINGAKISEVLMMLNKDFVKWVVIAFVIATPIAWYAMHKWLENFAYKTSLSWWIFALAGLLALGIALLTVSWQSWRAATRNPVEALRYE